MDGCATSWHRCPTDNQLAGRDYLAASLHLADPRPILLQKQHGTPLPLQKPPPNPGPVMPTSALIWHLIKPPHLLRIWLLG